jgi:hypothetical protein
VAAGRPSLRADIDAAAMMHKSVFMFAQYQAVRALRESVAADLAVIHHIHLFSKTNKVFGQGNIYILCYLAGLALFLQVKSGIGGKTYKL